MRTWSIESAFIRAYSTAAVVAQGVIDVFTHRPGYSNSHPIPGCPNASDCREYGCAGNCSEALDYEAVSPDGYYGYAEPNPPLADWERELLGATGHTHDHTERADALGPYVAAGEHFADDTPNPTEPGLTDDELVGVRGLLQERYDNGAWTGEGRCVFCGATEEYVAHSGGCVGPLCPHKSEPDCGLGSPPAASAAGSSGEEVASVNPPDVPSSPRSTAELLNDAASHLDHYLNQYEESLTAALNGRAFTAQLRLRAAEFQADEDAGIKW